MVIIDKMEKRTIQEQLRLKLCKNLRTTKLSKNLSGSYKKKHVHDCNMSTITLIFGLMVASV